MTSKICGLFNTKLNIVVWCAADVGAELYLGPQANRGNGRGGVRKSQDGNNVSWCAIYVGDDSNICCL